MLKFSVDGATREKPQLAGIGLLCHSDAIVSAMFSKNIGILKSDETNWKF